MRNFWLITKLSLSHVLDIKAIFGKNSKNSDGKKVSLTVFGILLLVYLFGVSAFVVNMVGEFLNSLGMISFLIPLNFIMGFALVFMTGLFKSPAILFQGKDVEKLMVLPIKMNAIISSKITTLLIYEYLVMLFIYIPAGVVYANYANPEPLFYLYLVIVFLATPIIPLSISSILGCGVAYLASKTKKKNLFTTVFSLGFLVLFMLAYMNIDSILDDLGQNIQQIIDIMGTIYKPMIWVAQMCNNFDVVAALYFIGVTVVTLVAFIALVTAMFKKMYTALGAVSKSKAYKRKALSVTPIKLALFKREVARLFAIPVYSLNAISGSVMLLILSIYVMFKSDIIELASMAVGSDLIMCGVIAGMCFLTGITPTTNCAISLDAKNWWILKTAPIETKDIIKSKISLNMVINGATILITGSIFNYILKPDLILAISVFAVPLVFNYMASYVGIMINISMPKMNWDNEMQAVKQSGSVIVTMLVIFAVVITLGLLAVFSSLITGDIKITLGSLFGLLVIVSVGIRAIVLRRGVKMYDRIS